VDRPFIATVQIAGPFEISASPVWIKAKDREPAVTGEQISLDSVKAESSDAKSVIERIIDGSGMKDRDDDGLPEHSTVLSDMWLSGRGQTTGWIEFDLGAVYKLDLIKVWNFNVGNRTNEGLKKVDVSIWTESEGWQKIRDDFQLLEAEGNDDYDEPTLVKLDGIETSKVRFDDLVNLGDTESMGLSEVQFFKVRGPKALRPRPSDGSNDVRVTDLSLKWMPGLRTYPNNPLMADIFKGNGAFERIQERKTKNRYRISDELWEKIEPLLPKHPNTHRFGGGRPRVPDRQATWTASFSYCEPAVNGML
jgi:hypothetical protein